jgi:hypothetical protein
MNIVRRTVEIDAGTDARLTEMAAERGQDVAAVLAEAVALLDSVVECARQGAAEWRGSPAARRAFLDPPETKQDVARALR